MPSGESLCRLRIKRYHPEERSDEESALLFHAPTLLALLALRLRRAFSGAPPFLKGGSCLCVAQGARRCCGALGLSRSFVFVVIRRSIATRNLLFLFAFNVAPGFSPASFSLAQNLACPRPGFHRAERLVIILSAASRAVSFRKSCPHDFLLPAKVTNRMSFRRVNKVQREVEARILPPMPSGESLRCRCLTPPSRASPP
jgi:hypothetical protein